MKEKVWCICLICGLMTTAAMVQAESRWLEPTNGWDLVYAASDGILPEDASPNWKGATTFAAGAISLVTDDMTGEPALHMDMTSASSKYQYGNYKIDTGVGQFTTNDLTTCDFRFRLMDTSQPDESFQLTLVLDGPRPSGETDVCQSFNVRLSKDRIRVNNNGVNKDYMTPLGTNWHTMRCLINWKTREAKMYLDQMIMPVLEYRSYYYDHPYNFVQFGDPSSAIAGIARISYLRLTHNELVEPSFVHDGDTDPETEGWVYYTTARTLDYAASNGILPTAVTPAWSGRWGSGMASLVQDEITGEDVLHLNMTNETYTYASYSQGNVNGQFTTNDLATCRFGFRLIGDTNGAQLVFSISSPRPDGEIGKQSFHMTFSRDRIQYLNNSRVYTDYLTPLATDWHEVVWIQNHNTREAEVYLDGSVLPVFTHKSTLRPEVANQVMFGDGSAGVAGVARVSYVSVTRQGLTWGGGAEEGAPYWEGISAGTASGYYYFDALPPETLEHPEGWTASCNLRVATVSPANSDIGMSVQDGTDQWSMIFRPGFIYTHDSSTNTVRLGKFGRSDLYHTFQFYYDPSGDSGNGTVSYYDNGWLIGTRTRAEVPDFVPDSEAFLWGSMSMGAVSTQRWNRVEFAPGNRVIPPVPHAGTVIYIF